MEKTTPNSEETIAFQEAYLKLFTNLSRVVSQTSEKSRLIASFVDIIQSVLDVESCSIMLLTPDRSELRLEASSTIPESMWNSIRLPIGEGVAGKVAESGQSTFVSRDQGKRPPGARPRRSYRSESFVSVPLLSHGDAMGVINVTERRGGRDLNETDLHVLEAIARLVAGAIESHRLWNRTREAHEHLSQVLEGLPLGMFTVSDQRRLSLCNSAARRYLGLSPGEELDRPWKSYFAEPFRSEVAEALARIAGGENSFTSEFPWPSARETVEDRAVRMSALKLGEITQLDSDHVLFIIEDLRQVQELIELRRSGQMKSDFLSLISHELRTPLASIKGAIHLLNQLAPPEMRKSTERVFAILHRNSDRLTRLVNSILDVMDLEAGTLSLYRKRANLDEVVGRVADKLRHGQSDKRLKWEISLRAERPEFYVDESRIGQVIDHMLENAVKFASDGGSVQIDSRNDIGRWVLSVANTGRAIDAAQQEKIFTKFYQIDGSLTRECGGSGLGLYLCREIVRLHGGEIQVDPTFTEGARFVVILPEVHTLGGPLIGAPPGPDAPDAPGPSPDPGAGRATPGGERGPVSG